MNNNTFIHRTARAALLLFTMLTASTVSSFSLWVPHIWSRKRKSNSITFAFLMQETIRD